MTTEHLLGEVEDLWTKGREIHHAIPHLARTEPDTLRTWSEGLPDCPEYTGLKREIQTTLLMV